MAALPDSFEVTLDEVKQETPDTATLYFRVPPAHREYRAGQYASIAPQQFDALAGLRTSLEAEKGKRELPRKYSLTSAPHEPRLAMTVKEEAFDPPHTRYRPLLSGHLVRGLEPGAQLIVFGYAGPYVLPEILPRGQLIVHVVAGTGAVPNFSILKDALHRGVAARHLWIASNKRREDVLFHDELFELERAHPEQLRVVNTLTRENQPGFRCGRIDEALLRDLLPMPALATCLVYACGPAVQPWDRKAALEAGTSPTPRFMESVLGHLHSLGVDDRRIKRETYG